MKVIERWYEKLLGYDWHQRLRQQFTFLEWLLILAFSVFIILWLYDWLIEGIL